MPGYASVTRFIVVTFFFVLWTEPYVIAGDASPPETLPNVTVTFLEGESYVMLPVTGQRRLVAAETFSAGSIFKTGAASKLELTFADRGIVRLDENTTIELAFDQTTRTQAWQYQLMLTEGKLWVNLPVVEPGRNTLQVLTSDALFLGPGGVFRATSYPDGAVAVNVYGGQVTAAGPFEITKDDSSFLLTDLEKNGLDDVASWQYRIDPYRKLIVRSNGEGTKPFRFSGKSDETAWVRWNRQRDEAGK